MSLDTITNNVGEYYSAHYLTSTFSKDVKDDRILNSVLYVGRSMFK